MSHTGPVLGNRRSYSIEKVPFNGQPISCPTWKTRLSTALSHMKQGPTVAPNSSSPAGQTSVPCPRSCSATSHNARGAKLSMSSSAPFRMKKRCPLPLKYGSPPPRGLCTFNLALSSSVIENHVEGSPPFHTGKVSLNRLPHFVTPLTAECRIKYRWEYQESLAFELGNLVCFQGADLLQNQGRHRHFLLLFDRQ